MSLHPPSGYNEEPPGPVPVLPELLKETFRSQFTRLTDTVNPFAWQEELFATLLDGLPPHRVDLPTGAGKTSVMPIWLLALAAQAKRGSVSLPRRLVWVVDRRVVVDQATEEADKLANRLEKEPDLAEVREALALLSHSVAPSDNPVAVSTLRGEREDNREWSENPTRPAIIVGTVDMVGSRLLFSGYGDSRRRRALHSGLLGQDALIVNDEAHLTPAFAALVSQLTGQTGGPRPARAMLLSATQRDNDDQAFPKSLDADLADEGCEFAKRYRAVKRLHMLPPADRSKDEIRKLALKPDRRTIVFVRSPEDARELAAAIEREHNWARVPLITGTQRGYERDRLPLDDIFKRFLSKDTQAPDDPPCWLVATSAGEVGVDLSADRLVTDLDTADHLLQRFGRLNRFGKNEGDAYVVYSPKQIESDKEQSRRLKATIDYLKALGGSVSVESIRKRPPPAAAISQCPNLAPLAPWLIDVWSLTSINAKDWPSRPAVEPWLHGDGESSPPETYVAWRKDVADLAAEGVSTRDLENVFECFPVLAHERLKQYTGSLLEKLDQPAYWELSAILITAGGDIFANKLGQLLEERDFRYATLVLQPGIGRLDAKGMVDWSRPGDPEAANYDVSETKGRSKRRLAPEEEPSERPRCSVEIPGENEDEAGARWVYFVERRTPSGHSLELLIENHQAQVAKVAANLARHLTFDERMIRIFEWASEWHDSGKRRSVWQRAAGNHNGGPALAKSREPFKFNGRLLGGYRHELGSLLDAEAQLPTDFTLEERDLALHLIAAHHGWARPHFPERAYDQMAYRRSELLALECARRFGRLHQRHGAWGLAYLEAIFRSADAIASANTPELPVHA